MKRILFPLVFIIITLTSCREEIIPPNNPTGNMNQPVKEVTLNSYSFLINAGDITYNLYDYVRFENSRAQVYLSIFDYNSGSVEISLIGKSKRVIYSKKVESDLNGEYFRITNEIPDAVIINFKDFTGKFKLTVSQY
jgi:hypothetical protein